MQQHRTSEMSTREKETNSTDTTSSSKTNINKGLNGNEDKEEDNGID